MEAVDVKQGNSGEIPSKIAKAPKKDKTQKVKAPKVKAPKTSFTGRLEEIMIAADGGVNVTLVSKRDKQHVFSLGTANSASAAISQLLCSAVAKKLKVQVNVVADNTSQIASIALHARK